jgi:four helix bundle protein
MSSRQRLDGLVSWRAARALAAAVHRATGEVAFHVDPELRAGLRAAATDIMAAIAEGYEQRTCAEFDRRLAAALGATARLESQVCLAADLGLLTRDAELRLRRRATEVADLIDALRQAVTRYQRLQAMPSPSGVN